MGPAMLKAIETAARKLERLDPEYAARMKTNRRTFTLARRREITNDFVRNYHRLITANNEAEEAAFHSDQTLVETMLSEPKVLHGNVKFKIDPRRTYRTPMKQFPTRFVGVVYKRYMYRGKSMSVAEISETYELNIHTLNSRLRSGWAIDDAINRPVRERITMKKASTDGGWVETSEDTLRTGQLHSLDTAAK